MCNPHSVRYSRRGVRSLHAVSAGLILLLGLPLRGTTWGQPVGAEFQVNTFTLSFQISPAVAANAAGDFVVVWTSDLPDGSGYGVFGQRYTSAGAAVGTEFQVNTYTTGDQYIAVGTAVAADADGDFVVTWVSKSSQDGSAQGVFGQRYTSAGAAVGAEFQVNTTTLFNQFFPGVAADADGDFVVVWTDENIFDNPNVFGQRFQPIAPSTTTTTTTSTTTLPPPIPALSSGGGVILGVLLMLPMVWGFRRRLVGSSATLRE